MNSFEGKYKVRVLGGVLEQREILTKLSNNTNVDLQRSQEKYQQEWEFRLSSGQDGSYNILTTDPNMSKQKFLSVVPDGSKVDLWDKDDGSGRQRWTIVQVGTKKDVFHLIIKQGRTSDKKFLSCGKFGKDVNLWHKDDGSGRQEWIVKKVK